MNGNGFDTYPAASVRHGPCMADGDSNVMAAPGDAGRDGFFTGTRKNR